MSEGYSHNDNILDTITFFTVIAGIIRAGYTAFPISTRNSPAAVAHLLQKVNVAHVLVGAESALQALIAESLTLVKDQAQPPTSPMLSFSDIYPAEDHELFVPLPPVKHGADDASYILHSSGSCLPKADYLDPPSGRTGRPHSLLVIAPFTFFKQVCLKLGLMYRLR